MAKDSRCHGAYVMRVGQANSPQHFNTVEQAEKAARERAINGAKYVVYVPEKEFRSTVEEVDC